MIVKFTQKCELGVIEREDAYEVSAYEYWSTSQSKTEGNRPRIVLTHKGAMAKLVGEQTEHYIDSTVYVMNDEGKTISKLGPEEKKVFTAAEMVHESYITDFNDVISKIISDFGPEEKLTTHKIVKKLETTCGSKFPTTWSSVGYVAHALNEMGYRSKLVRSGEAIVRAWVK